MCHNRLIAPYKPVKAHLWDDVGGSIDIISEIGPTTRFSFLSRSKRRVPGGAWRMPTMAVTIPLSE